MTNIEWTDKTDNVFVVQGEDGQPDGWYCYKVSPGCAGCYAERLNGSGFFKGNGMPYRMPADGEFPPMMIRRDVIAGWPKLRKPYKHFVNSMTDTFGDFISDDMVFELFDGMAAAPLQTFQVLTKRTKRCVDLVWTWLQRKRLRTMPANIWFGFSAEDQTWFDVRWADMQGLYTMVGTIFVSAEPLLGPINLGLHETRSVHEDLQRLDMIRWIIVGGESGSKARPVNPEWVRSLRNQCHMAGTPFHFKQWGEWLSQSDQFLKNATVDSLRKFRRHTFDPDTLAPIHMWRVGKKSAGRLLDGRTWDQFPGDTDVPPLLNLTELQL